MVVNAAVIIEKNKQLLNDLNVFPVHDGDTGTNMSLTINYSVNGLSSLTPTGLTRWPIRLRPVCAAPTGTPGYNLAFLRGMARASGMTMPTRDCSPRHEIGRGKRRAVR